MKRYLVYISPEEINKQLHSIVSSISGQVGMRPPLSPHCTLMRAIVRDDVDEQEIASVLGEIAKKEKGLFEIKPKQLAMYDKDVLVIELEKTARIAGLHKAIIDGLQPFLDLSDENIDAKFKDDSARVAVAKKYGTHYADEFYKPHITLAYMLPPAEIPRHIDGIEKLNFYADKFDLAVKLAKSEQEKSKWFPTNRFVLGE